MIYSKMLLIFGTMLLLQHFSIGRPNEKGLIIGMYDPAALTTIRDIEDDSTDIFLKSLYLLMESSGALITSIASDPSLSVVFTALNNGIYITPDFSIWLNSSKEFFLSYKGRYSRIDQIAYDYITGNLYWCDSMYDWIAMKHIYTIKKEIYNVVIRTDLNQPEGLALDPGERLLFFSDYGPNSRIERASLDGQDRKVIVYKGLLRAYSLTVDTENNKLYWTDFSRHTLEGCDYDGSNRRVIRRMNGVSLTGLTYHQGTLYAVSFFGKTIYKVDLTSESLVYSRKFISGEPYTINVYDAETIKSKEDPCLTMSCDHICVDTKTGPICLCSDGFELNSDGTTCTDRSYIVDGMFIVSNASMFAVHRLHFVDGQRSVLPSVQLPVANIETFDVDTKSKTIYFVDSGSRTLKKHDIISLRTKTLTSVSSATAKDLTLDWISNILAWIEPTLSCIQSFSISTQTSATIYSNLQQPASLTVDPHSGVLYWISGTPSARSIVQGSWTRDVPRILISAANLENPSSLQYDVQTNRLYWLDRSVIKSSTMNGMDIESHIVTKGAIKTIVYKDFFGWIDENKIYTARRTSKNAETTLNTVRNAKDISVFDSTLQQDKRGSCQIQNGNCGDICVQEENGRRCECDIGLQLQPDQSCASEVLRSNFILVTDYTHGRILQVDLQTGNLVKLPITIKEAVGLAFDETTMTIFYSDASTNSISYTTLNGENGTVLYTTGFAYADRLAIDFSTGNLYYTAVGSTTLQSYIGVVHRSTSLHRILIYNLYKPREIALHSSKGYMFWTEIGIMNRIGRASMDGTSKRYIATSEKELTTGLTIDFISDRLYWTDAQFNRIESSDLNGGNRQVLATDNDAFLMSIVNQGQFLYYTAWHRQRITKMDKLTGSKVSFMLNYPELGRLDSLDIYTDELREISSSCSNQNGQCSTFCFPTPNGRTCGCQDNVKLQSDQLTCDGVSRCQTLHHTLKFIDCRPYPGLTCNFECKTGYQIGSITTVTCSSTGIWVPSIDILCKEKLCPMHLGNAVLSPNCKRKIGDVCPFNCMKGYLPTKSTSLVCTAEGSWHVDGDTLCLPILCPVLLGNAVLSSSCSRRTGESCTFSCTGDFIPTTSDRLMCTTEGSWNLDTASLCTPELCPATIENGHLAENCERRIGNICSFTCHEKHRSSIDPENIICTTGGLWNPGTHKLCLPIKCPLDIDNGYLSPSCRGMVDEKCVVSCGVDTSMSTVDIICLSSGAWNKDISDICRLHHESGKNMTYREIDFRVLFVVGVIVVLITLVFRWYKCI